MNPAISVKGISKRYLLEGGGADPRRRNLSDKFRRAFMADAKTPAANGAKTFIALDDVSFEVSKGERVGFIGANGAGKSTLLKILARIIPPSEGEARLRGRVAAILELGTGFRNELTGRDNVYLYAGLNGVSRGEVDIRLGDIIEFAGIGEFMDIPLRHYSTGMRARLAYSAATHFDPDVLLLDEILAVGDMRFQNKCLARVEDIFARQPTVLLVSHSVSTISSYCSRCIWLDHGRIIMDGPAEEVTASYAKESLKLVGQYKPNELPPAPKSDTDSEPVSAYPARDSRIAARIVLASILNRKFSDAPIIRADEELRIEVVYDVLTKKLKIIPRLRFRNADGVLLFVTNQSDPSKISKDQAIGRYRSVVRVPAHFFNVDKIISVSVALTSPLPRGGLRHDFAEGALSFAVHDVPDGQPSGRGPYKEVDGVMRFALDWETNAVAEVPMKETS